MLGVMSANKSPPRSFRHDDLVIPRMLERQWLRFCPAIAAGLSASPGTGWKKGAFDVGGNR
jgi:hypothetical protein